MLSVFFRYPLGVILVDLAEAYYYLWMFAIEGVYRMRDDFLLSSFFFGGELMYFFSEELCLAGLGDLDASDS